MQGTATLAPMSGAFGDCELIQRGLLAQPVNALTTLPFLFLGGWLALRRSPWVGIAVMATGLGSFLFHGPMPEWGEWAHDVTLAWLIAIIGGLGTRWEWWSRLPALAILATLFAALPGAADPVSGTLAVVIAGAILLRRPPIRELLPIGLLGVVAILGRLGATGGILCDPGSLWQWHGLWHVGAAAGVTWWVIVTERRMSPRWRPTEN